jgi:hypothetical protein
MDPNTAFSIGRYLEDQQRERMAARTERLTGLSSLLNEYASTGGDFGGAEALLDAQPGPMGPAVQGMLQGAYPSAGGQAEWQQSLVDPDPTQTGDVVGAPSMQAFQNQRQSPMYTGNPMAQAQVQGAQMAMQAPMMDAQLAAEQMADWGVFQQDMARARQNGIDPQTAVQQFALKDPANAQLLASDDGKVKGILQATFGQSALLGIEQG